MKTQSTRDDVLGGAEQRDLSKSDKGAKKLRKSKSGSDIDLDEFDPSRSVDSLRNSLPLGTT